MVGYFFLLIFDLSFKNIENMEKEIEGVEILGVDIDFDCIIEFGCLNLGSIRLEREGRSFVFDTVRSEWYVEDDGTSISVTLEAGIDGSCEDVDSDFNLTAMDLMANDLKATIFIDVDDEDDLTFQDPISMTLSVKIGEIIKVIDLEYEE